MLAPLATGCAEEDPAVDDTVDTDDSAADDAGDDAADDSAAGGETVEVIAADYSFEAPDEVAVGTELTMTNASAEEAHEMVLNRIADDETRSLEELLELPEEEVGEAVAFEAVSVALPGEDGTTLEGDFVLDEPGRYALLCFIPVGADPEVVAEAMEGGEESEGPPELGDGPPHAEEGMYHEFTVTE